MHVNIITFPDTTNDGYFACCLQQVPVTLLNMSVRVAKLENIGQVWGKTREEAVDNMSKFIENTISKTLGEGVCLHDVEIGGEDSSQEEERAEIPMSLKTACMSLHSQLLQHTGALSGQTKFEMCELIETLSRVLKSY